MGWRVCLYGPVVSSSASVYGTWTCPNCSQVNACDGGYDRAIVNGQLTACILGFLVVACGSSGKNSNTPSPTPDVCANAAIHDAHMCLTLSPGATVSGPATSSGYTTYRFSDGGLTGEFGILPLTGLLPSTGTTTSPAALLQELRTENLLTLALTIDGVSTGSTNFHIPEQSHLVPVEGQQCAQMGSESTYQGVTGDGVYLNCRYHDELYNVILGAPAPSVTALDANMASLVKGWKWR
jgi:hypothetical protein